MELNKKQWDKIHKIMGAFKMTPKNKLLEFAETVFKAGIVSERSEWRDRILVAAREKTMARKRRK